MLDGRAGRVYFAGGGHLQSSNPNLNDVAHQRVKVGRPDLVYGGWQGTGVEGEAGLLHARRRLHLDSAVGCGGRHVEEGDDERLFESRAHDLAPALRGGVGGALLEGTLNFFQPVYVAIEI